MIEGLSHITFIVKDLEKMEKLLETIFDAKEVYSSGNKSFSISKEKFFLINDLWIAIMQGEALPIQSYNHVAFKIPENEIELYANRIRSLGLQIREDRSRVHGEGQSLYFYDCDNHLFELHTGTLQMRLQQYRKAGAQI
jgi:fosfomycin resistance protein FosX